LGNQVFKEQGATIVSQSDAAQVMEKYFDKDVARRGGFFKRHRFDPSEIKMTLPDVTFETKMNIKLGGKVAHLSRPRPRSGRLIHLLPPREGIGNRREFRQAELG
jgi:hypothetical protein